MITLSPAYAIKIAATISHAISVFDNETKAEKWLETPNRALDNKKPIELFDTEEGLRKVRTILARIEEGIYT